MFLVLCAAIRTRSNSRLHDLFSGFKIKQVFTFEAISHADTFPNRVVVVMRVMTKWTVIYNDIFEPITRFCFYHLVSLHPAVSGRAVIRVYIYIRQ